ncbi:MAG: Abi family protein [Rickettsiales bacterium]|nr:Abi family protein [Rickettsiales bacterium]
MSETNFKQRIKELLIEAVSTQLDESEVSSSFDDNFKLNYTKHLSCDKWLVGFELDLGEMEGFIANLNYNNLFSISDEIANIFVYKKAEVLLFEEINSIEQKLREALVYIFVQQYPENVYDLLKEIEVKVVGDAPKNDKKFAELAENQFFYLLFTHYIKLSDLKPLGEKDLINYVQNSDSYEDLKKNLLNRGITNPAHKNFLLSLKDVMQPIEDLRNCIAHNRSVNDDIFTNFMDAKEKFNERLESFWSEEADK